MKEVIFMSKLKYLLCLFSALCLAGCQTTHAVASLEPSENPAQLATNSPLTPPSPETASETPSQTSEALIPSEDPKPSHMPLAIVNDEVLDAPFFEANSPAAKHGKLQVVGTELVDSTGAPYQLRGISTHGIQWFSQYLNPTIFASLRDDLHMNSIRLALYADYSGGYFENQEAYTKLLEEAIEDASALGLYVIIDWHLLEDQDPTIHQENAATFFEYFSMKYQNYPNVIYELCNEPNGNQVTWSDQIKPYAQAVIPIIRHNVPDSVIIVGTPHWCQSPLAAADDPLEEENVLYALHFYAASHGTILRNTLSSAVNDKALPMIISEFGTCDASGDGAVDEEATTKWLSLIDSLNISWFNWSLCDKDESSALLLPNTPADQPISDENLTESGKLIKAILLRYPED